MMVPDKITLDFANEALKDYVNTNIYINNSIASIQNVVAEYFNISVERFMAFLMGKVYSFREFIGN